MLQAIVDLRSISPPPATRAVTSGTSRTSPSIAAVGLLEPLVVAPWPADLGLTRTRPAPRVGHREVSDPGRRDREGVACRPPGRLRRGGPGPSTSRSVAIAAWPRVLTAGATDVPVVVRDDLTTTSAQLEAMLVENLHRADLT